MVGESLSPPITHDERKKDYKDQRQRSTLERQMMVISFVKFARK